MPSNGTTGNVRERQVVDVRVYEVMIFSRQLSESDGWYEPAPSRRELSVRQMRTGAQFIRHRFPFRDALSERQVMSAYLAWKYGGR